MPHQHAPIDDLGNSFVKDQPKIGGIQRSLKIRQKEFSQLENVMKARVWLEGDKAEQVEQADLQGKDDDCSGSPRTSILGSP